MTSTATTTTGVTTAASWRKPTMPAVSQLGRFETSRTRSVDILRTPSG